MSHAAPMRASDRPEPVASVERPLVIDPLQQTEVWTRTGAVASWLIAQGFGPQSAPVAILSDDSLENALFLFGVLRADVRVAPLSPDHSLSVDLAEPTFPQAIVAGGCG